MPTAIPPPLGLLQLVALSLLALSSSAMTEQECLSLLCRDEQDCAEGSDKNQMYRKVCGELGIYKSLAGECRGQAQLALYPIYHSHARDSLCARLDRRRKSRWQIPEEELRTALNPGEADKGAAYHPRRRDKLPASWSAMV